MARSRNGHVTDYLKKTPIVLNFVRIIKIKMDLKILKKTSGLTKPHYKYINKKYLKQTLGKELIFTFIKIKQKKIYNIF